MADPITEYTARDYSAVDKQIEQIAQREQVVTQRLKLANLRRALVLAIAGLLAFGLFLILAAWAYRIAFKPEVRVIETTKVVEKIVPKIIETQVVVEKAGPPQNIIIQTPEGSRIGTTDQSPSFVEQTPEVTSLDGQEEASAIQEMDARLQDSGVNNAGSDMSITLSWNNYNDLDLVVQEPNGTKIFFSKKRSETQGELNVDANANASQRTSRPVENIKWPIGKAPLGQYKVFVMFYKKSHTEESSGVTPYRVRMIYGGQDKVFSGSFANNTREKTKTEIATLTLAGSGS